MYAAGLGAAAVALEPGRRRAGLFILAVAVAVLAADLLVARPAFLDGREPSYLQYWSGYGGSTAEVARTMLTSPLRVATEVLRSKWLTLFGPVLLLPFLSGRATLAMAPALVVFGTSTQLRDYRGYSIAAVLPFFFWGLLEAVRRLDRVEKLAPARRLYVLAALMMMPLFGTYVRIERPQFDAMGAWPGVVERLRAGSGPVCAQLSLFPHLPYGLAAEALTDECSSRPGALSVLNVRFDPYPYDGPTLARSIEAAQAKGRAEDLGAGFVVIDQSGSR
ncbi:MAG: DUF2079 domain-containing protein [Myxococcaceae bacterium]